MRKWPIYLLSLAVVLLLGWMPFEGTDVAQLQPVRVIRISLELGRVTVETDTGDLGVGKNGQEAILNLKETTVGQVFLDTADFILVDEKSLQLLPELADVLRPGCGACLADGKMDLKDAGEFLEIHSPKFTLQDIRAGQSKLEKLTVSKGRLELAAE
jgi:hypothetical protein